MKRRPLCLLFDGLTLLSLALLLAFLALPLRTTWGDWGIIHRDGWFTVQNGALPPLIDWRGWWVMNGYLILPTLWWMAFRRGSTAMARRDNGGVLSVE